MSAGGRSAGDRFIRPTRRDVLIGAAALAALPARAQSRIANVAALLGGAAGDPAVAGFLSALVAGLSSEGWDDGRNLVLRPYYTAGSATLAAEAAAEIVASAPDAILANTTPNTSALLERTHTLPIVFLPVADPVSAGFVESYARPGGNATGFTNFEPSHTGKWLSYLLDVAPHLRRVALMYNPAAAPMGGAYYQPAFDAAARELGLEPLAIPVLTREDIPGSIRDLAAVPATGLVGSADIFMWNCRATVEEATRQHLMPSIYPFVNYTEEGGLMSYSVNTLDLFERGGEYLGRILNGADVATMPVQSPALFSLAINLRTAAELGLTVPMAMIVAADLLIE